MMFLESLRQNEVHCKNLYILKGIIVLLLEHIATNFKILIKGAYLPPANSIYGKDPCAFFAKLLSSSYKYEADMYVSVGDFNSRVGSELEVVDCVTSLPKRKIIDTVKNAHGDSFITYLQDSGECILNGRITPHLDDWTNKSTCNIGGCSVVDYFTCNYEYLHYFEELKVIPFSDFIEQSSLIDQIKSTAKLGNHSILWATLNFSDFAHLKQNVSEGPNSSKEKSPEQFKEKMSKDTNLVQSQIPFTQMKFFATIL